MSKMKKVLAGLVLSTVVATSVYAKCERNNDTKHEVNHSKHYKHSSSKMKMPIISKFKHLDLSVEQKEKMKNLIKEFRTKRDSLNEVFKNKTFNKDLYIKNMSEKRENMLKSKAQLIEKAYAILDEKQKIKFEELINKKK